MISRSCRVSSKDGYDADIGGARGQLVGATRRWQEFQVEKIAPGPMEHAPDQRRGIQVADGRNPRPLRDNVAQPHSLSDAFASTRSKLRVRSGTPYRVVRQCAFDILSEVRSPRRAALDFPCYLRTSIFTVTACTLVCAYCRTRADHPEYGAHARDRPTATARPTLSPFPTPIPIWWKAANCTIPRGRAGYFGNAAADLRRRHRQQPDSRLEGRGWLHQRRQGRPGNRAARLLLHRRQWSRTLGGLSTGFAAPTGLAVDQGDLYVADSGNNRVLRFRKPFTTPPDQLIPDLCIGQPSFNAEQAQLSAGRTRRQPKRASR